MSNLLKVVVFLIFNLFILLPQAYGQQQEIKGPFGPYYDYCNGLAGNWQPEICGESAMNINCTYHEGTFGTTYTGTQCCQQLFYNAGSPNWSSAQCQVVQECGTYLPSIGGRCAGSFYCTLPPPTSCSGGSSILYSSLSSPAPLTNSPPRSTTNVC